MTAGYNLLPWLSTQERSAGVSPASAGEMPASFSTP